MSMSEYEERFRPPAPSLYQTLTVAAGRNAGRRRRRIWVVAAAIGVLAITWGAASHHAVHGWTSSHSRTTAFYGQRLAAAVSDVFPAGRGRPMLTRLPGTRAHLRFFRQQSGSLPMPAAKRHNGRLMTEGINTLWNVLYRRSSRPRPRFTSVRSVKPKFVSRDRVAAGGRHVQHAWHRVIAGRALWRRRDAASHATRRRNGKRCSSGSKRCASGSLGRDRARKWHVLIRRPVARPRKNRREPVIGSKHVPPQIHMMTDV